MNNFHRNHGCGGCCGRRHDNFCPPSSTNGNNRCQALGPFVAIDRDCLLPPRNTGSIIPFASGLVPVALTSLVGGLAGIPFFIGFGTAIPSPAVLGTTINLTGLINEAFSVPRAGSITAISASYTITTALNIVGQTATVNAQVYRAPAGSNTFTPTGVSVNLNPPLTSLITAGTTLFGNSSNFSPVPVAVGDRLLMVFSISGTTVATVAIGTASAGITIE